ncbi:MAG TPA: hypothetical protein VGY48_15915 [Vicinamibacterales bacterium]|jgi:hypothetical protein|nr:hypothetical protein [Vicinamibacterales bacterium]
MTLAEQFPHPGPAPAKPIMNAPTKEVFAYNDWVKNLRRHLVAASVDKLLAIEVEKGTDALTPEQLIAAMLGRAFLEDTLSSHNPLAGLFGGFG